VIKLIGTPRKIVNEFMIKRIWEDCTGFVGFCDACGLRLPMKQIIFYWNKFEKENKK